MNRALRTTLLVLGGLVLAVLLFGIGTQLFWMFASPATAGFGSMMQGGWGMHPFGGMGGFSFLGPILGLGLVALVIAGFVALAGGKSPDRSTANCTNCGSALVAGWTFCPRCGQKV